MNENREDVVRSALIIERWCKEHFKKDGVCDCPFFDGGGNLPFCKISGFIPKAWQLEEFLRNRGS